MSIITRRGDDGETDLLFGRRVAKTDLRVEAVGAVDELNAALGVARAAGLPDEHEAHIDRIQEHLVGLMGQLACLEEDREKYEQQGFSKVGEDEVEWVEQVAKEFEARGIQFKGWARPGVDQSEGRAGLDLARAVARRAERRVLELDERDGGVPLEVRLYFNRLADLLWILARSERPR